MAATNIAQERVMTASKPANNALGHLPGLDGIRACAVLLVFAYHEEAFKSYAGHVPLWSDDFGAHLGATGVTIFFALSGFLITLLLRTERLNFGNISMRSFYLRRVLRIWPLYYLLVVCAFFVFPHLEALHLPVYWTDMGDDTWKKFLLFVFLLPNVAFVFHSTVPYANVLWSVGVEEQFYLAWPWLVQRTRYPITIAMALFLGFKGAAILGYLSIELVQRTRISCMLMGALGAHVVLMQNKRLLTALFSLPSQLFGWFGLFAMIGQLLPLPWISVSFRQEITSLFASVIIVNVAFNQAAIIKLESAPLRYLGKLSYGLYVFHSVAIGLSIALIQGLPGVVQQRWAWSVLLPLVAAAMSIAMSHVSYLHFERPFLQLKQKLSRVAREDALESPSQETHARPQSASDYN